MKRILIITSDFDKTVDYFFRKYKNKADIFIFNVNRFTEYKIHIDNEGWHIVNVNGESISENETYSIYYRKPTLPNLNEFGDIDRMIIQNDIITILHGIANSFNGIVLTRPSKLKLVENKAFQLLFAIKNNINIPKSFMGNSNYELQKLVDNTSIIKPISRGKYTNKNETVLFQTEIFSHWSEDINSTPIYVQKYIEKQYEVRITVVGQCIFAVRIDTLNKIDWRKDYENHKYTIIDIPNEIKEFIYMCMNDFEIEFGAFDFIVNNADEWVFLEVNPNGQWLWLEQELNISISDEIFRLLLR